MYVTLRVCALGISTEEGFPKCVCCRPCRGAEDAGSKTGHWHNTSTSSSHPASQKQGYTLVSCLLSFHTPPWAAVHTPVLFFVGTPVLNSKSQRKMGIAAFCHGGHLDQFLRWKVFRMWVMLCFVDISGLLAGSVFRPSPVFSHEG